VLIFNVQDKKVLPPDKTNLGKILVKLNLEFQTWEFYDNAAKLRESKKQVANELQEQFLEEGNLNIYNIIIERGLQMEKVLKNGVDCRYLYLATI